MKITDMLNAYPEHTVPLPEVSVPSPERTKELTMNKIKSSRAKEYGIMFLDNSRNDKKER